MSTAATVPGNKFSYLTAEAGSTNSPKKSLKEVAMATNKQRQPRSVMLSHADLLRLSDQAAKEGQTQSEVIREAVRWYLDNQENAAHDAREAEVAKAIKYATDQLVMAIK